MGKSRKQFDVLASSMATLGASAAIAFAGMSSLDKIEAHLNKDLLYGRKVRKFDKNGCYIV